MLVLKNAVVRGRTTGGDESEALWTLPGFGPMTRVSTAIGDIYAQVLRKRDGVLTEAHGERQIVSVDRISLDAEFLASMQDAYPVLVRAGAFGQGVPVADMLLSPAQEISLDRQAPQTFVRARDLLGRPGVTRKQEDVVTYTTFRCGAPVCAKVEGIWARIAA